ncbi:MAG: GNAT family N-acetyltransferase [Chloroflexi bacterium]|nr:GNAT family N-acetyltransferase [Chloroflexota bacterium]
MPENAETTQQVPELRVRHLTIDDFPPWQSLRLRALRDHPDAFGSSYEDELASGSAERRGRFETSASGEMSAVFGAFTADGGLVGTAGFVRSPGAKVRHKGSLWGMYVAPEARGTGAATQLVAGVLATARQWGLEQVQLSVVVGNTAAHRLYERAGFVIFGQERHALHLPDGPCDELLMVRWL